MTPADYTLQLLPGARISGQVVVDGGGPLPAGHWIWLAARTPIGHLEARILQIPLGQFTAAAVEPGRYLLRLDHTQPSEWTIKSIVIGNREMLDIPIELTSGGEVSDVLVTLTNRQTELSGSLLAADGAPARGFTLAVFSTDARYWYERSARVQMLLPDGVGRYQIRGLPAGDYWLAAVSDVPAFPRGLTAELTEMSAAAVRVSLAHGERKRQDLRLQGRY
jgi:hypothetical protein